jgi:photosystem II stability/assembly factor-like uncharacterized protein
MPRLLLLLSLALTLSAQPFPQALFNQLQWRMIGPFRGGRVIAVSGVPGDPTTFYFGAVGGGVWKTGDAGVVWHPIFDGQPIANIGAIAVAPSNPNVVYVGTGEAAIRSQIGFGDGVYKSMDAGRTWKNVGLRDSRQIAKVVVDPHNPDLVYVAALGHAYGPNAERGVFRSADGGQHWQKVLDRGPEIGAADLAMDTANPKTLYACMWNARRSVWSQYPPLEGPGSGLFQSIDGGDHWTELKGHGLPASDWGRSGVAVSPGGKRVYALVAVKTAVKGASGIYRSDDAGATWTLASSDPRLTERPWYFSGLTVDPKNADVVYAPNVALFRSTDGAKTFDVLKGGPGGDDYHILWVDPNQTSRMVLGSDQGTNITVDGGRTWSTWFNQPTAQIYHVTTDNRFPYAVMGAQQDSGTAAVMSRTDHGQIDARDRFSVGGAEAGYIAVDTKDDNILYVGDTYGVLKRLDRRTGQAQIVTPWPLRVGGLTGAIAEQRYRFPWTAPIATSSAEPGAVYFGSQYVMKTLDGGLTWSEISPDLTGSTVKSGTAATGVVTPQTAIAAGYGVVYSIAPSPVDAGVIWAGTDTGLIHVTRDGGRNWQNVTPGLPIWSKVSQIEASHFDAAVAYASVDRHRMEDYKPYIYRTRDSGKTWSPIDAGLAEPAYINCVREDPLRRGLLYACTELGIAVSFDDGGHWQSLQLNLPTVSVRDLVVHGDDLVIATHGRGFWILDDAAPLRQIDAAAAAAPVLLYNPATAIRMSPEAFTGTPLPKEEPQANNPPDGAILDYFFKSAPKSEVTLEIRDAKGDLVRRFSTGDQAEPVRKPGAVADGWYVPPARLTANAGMNRFVWDLCYPAKTQAAGEDDFGHLTPGPQVLPGTYTLQLTADGKTYKQLLQVELDPRSKATAEDLSKQLELSLQIVKVLDQVNAKGGQKELAEDLVTALQVAESADRTPPASAYQILEEVRKKLAK